jgi:hypothetical protein
LSLYTLHKEQEKYLLITETKIHMYIFYGDYYETFFCKEICMHFESSVATALTAVLAGSKSERLDISQGTTGKGME